MKKTFESLLNLFNLKEKTNQMTIAELNAFNLRKEKIEKGKRSRAYISEINQLSLIHISEPTRPS